MQGTVPTDVRAVRCFQVDGREKLLRGRRLSQRRESPFHSFPIPEGGQMERRECASDGILCESTRSGELASFKDNEVGVFGGHWLSSTVH